MASHATNTIRSIRYKPLNSVRSEIRLLELQPSDNANTPVVGRLVNLPLTPELEFVGVSTLLGSTDATEQITINDHRIVLPENIGQALRHVRTVLWHQAEAESRASSSDESRHLKQKPAVVAKKQPGWLRQLFGGKRSAFQNSQLPNGKPPLRIWLDTICINPRDERELAEQYTIMAYAYRSAKMVVGWLGEKDETSDLAVELIRAVDRAMPPNFGTEEDKQLHPEHYAPRHIWLADLTHLWALEPGVDNFTEGRAWRAMSGFLSRPYFQRDWIISEICMASFPAFLLGDEILAWLEVIRWNRCNEELIDKSSDQFPDNYRELIDNFMPRGSINALLQEFNKRRAAGNLGSTPHGPWAS